MIRQIKFDGVSNYEIVYSGADLSLKIMQPNNVETVVNVAVESIADFANELQKSVQPLTKREPKTHDLSKSTASNKLAPKLNAEEVAYIKANFQEMVDITGSKNKAAKMFGKRYECTYQNILAIMSNRSWKSVAAEQSATKS